MFRLVLAIVLQFLILLPCYSWSLRKKKVAQPEPKIEEPVQVIPQDLEILIKSYPEINIQAEFNKEENDYIISFTNYDTPYVFYWADGAVLPKEEYENKGIYRTVVYPYNNEIRDPKTFTEEEKTKLREYGTVKNRKKDPGTPMFFFDALYCGESKRAIEPHIVVTKFLGKTTRVHEKVLVPLKNVEKKILEAEKESKEVKVFIKELKSSAAYHWREIDGTKRKSFHSLGIAVDLLPVAYHGGEVFWSWARDKNPDGWMMTSIKGRWMPPKEVIDAFESEGFIWGGYWSIWDNMHFEYHPELINKMNAD